MDVFVYSDESGVFDYVHNPYYVFGGIMFLSKASKDICARKYLKAEKDIRSAVHCPDDEIKASNISNKYKGKLFRSANILGLLLFYMMQIETVPMTIKKETAPLVQAKGLHQQSS